MPTTNITPTETPSIRAKVEISGEFEMRSGAETGGGTGCLFSSIKNRVAQYSQTVNVAPRGYSFIWPPHCGQINGRIFPGMLSPFTVNAAYVKR